MDKKISLDEITSFAKRRGFIFPSSEIYGGLAGVYDYGHYGVLLKNNIQAAWWKNMVLDRDDIVGLDSAIFMHPTTWKASGHVDSFNEALMDCKDCKFRMRADNVLEKFGIEADQMPLDEMNKKLDELREQGKLKCENCGRTNLTEARQINQLIRTNFGQPSLDLKTMGDEDFVYPRGETCQGIYLNYKNIVDTMRVKLPFGIAQIGKAFRNEVIARQFIFRTREFEQMEMQYFLSPEIMDEKYDYWKAERWSWYLSELGLPEEKLNWKKHVKLAHYAKQAFDIQYNFSCLGGFQEVEGIHQRGNWDLTRHSEFSGQKLEYFDSKTNTKFIPHIMETSVGLNRLVLAVIDNAYTVEDLGEGKSRTVLKILPKLAPVKVAIFPLQKDEKLKELASKIYHDIKKDMVAEFDDSGNIGKMYRRQDEIGTPFCVTVDFQSLEDNMVTIRERDTMKQERILITDLIKTVQDKIS
jgi:glycyl-tRNA synthetase